MRKRGDEPGVLTPAAAVPAEPAPAAVPAVPAPAAVPAERAPAEAQALPGPGSAERLCFIDRDLSWLQFNLRVLMEAGDAAVPLLERLKFLGIYQSNLDEFFMVRVGSLTHRAALLPDEADEKTGWTPAIQLREILTAVAEQQVTEEKVYRRLLQDLRDAGIDVLDYRKTSRSDEAMAKKFFSELRPLLSPRIVDGGHPFPFLGNREPCVAAVLARPDGFGLGLIPLFRLPKYRVCEVDGRQKVIITADLVRHFAPLVFKKEEIRETSVIQVIRNADVFIEDDMQSYDADFRASMEKMLRKRKRQQPVRLLVSGKPSGKLLAVLGKDLKVPEKNVAVTQVPFDLSFGAGLRRDPGMKYDERKPARTVHLQKGEFFPYLEKKDLLLSFPFQSMMPFVELLYEAADDPAVVSIKITLYRLSSSSKVAAALAYAADRGKSVLCLLELRARFDEQNNIDYSEVLEDAGCQVIYGLPAQKVHSKLCLITRQQGGAVSYITQVGTGNYNEVTSEQYTDLSLITSDPAVGRDAAAVFDALALGEVPGEAQVLWIAPNSFRSRVLALLERETARGPEGRVAIKVNSLNDLTVMHALVRASQAGVRVELFIRGICCLRPGLPGYTDNITVRSVVGRYLEHSRIFVFGPEGAESIFVGSGDLLNRNTQRRVEAFIECVTPETRVPVLEVMAAFRADREKGWRMDPDGSYRRDADGEGTGSQDALYRYFSRRSVEPLPPPEPPKKRGWLWRLFHRK